LKAKNNNTGPPGDLHGTATFLSYGRREEKGDSGPRFTFASALLAITCWISWPTGAMHCSWSRVARRPALR